MTKLFASKSSPRGSNGSESDDALPVWISEPPEIGCCNGEPTGSLLQLLIPGAQRSQQMGVPQASMNTGWLPPTVPISD